MAQLNIAEGQPAQAEKLLLLSRDEFRKANSQDQEIATVGDLAHALLDQGKTAEALKAIDSLRTAAKGIENPSVKSAFLIEAARVDAFSGKTAPALATLDSALQLANAHGFVLTQLRAKLTRAEIERKKGDAAKADAALAAIRADALSRGLPLIARQAENLRGK